MLTLGGVTKAYGPKVLFRDLSLQVFDRERVCLVGANGVGKTTLFQIITHELDADAGTIELLSGRRLGTLEQETDHLRGHTVLDVVADAAPAVELAGRELRLVALRLAETPNDRALLHRHGDLQSRFESLGGYRVEADAFTVLHGLGFTDDQAKGPTDALSGGWLMRVALARLLVAKPDLMLLDEPTNHLDLESVRWLEAFLRSYPGAVLVISHDRDFMNAIATRILELDAGQLDSYTGDYEAFCEARELRRAQAFKLGRLQQQKIDQLQRFVDRFRYKKSKASQAQAKLSQIARIERERVDAPKTQRRKMGLTFPAPRHHSDRPIVLDHVTFGYDPARPIFSDLEFALTRGTKAALVGPNGAGKTTLLKLCAGVLEPQDGKRQVPPNTHVGYFAQHQIESLDPSNRVGEELALAVPPGLLLNLRGLLGRFLFSGEDVDKPVRVLSGGERTRLALCKMLVSPFSVLCVDEPTNHLDLQSRDALEDALEEYEGALLLITHDSHLIRSVANTIVEVRPGGHVRIIRDDYETYLRLLGEEADAVPAVAMAGTARVATTGDRERKREEARARQAKSEVRKRVRAVETALETARTERVALEQRLADPAFYASGGDQVANAVRAHSDLDRQIIKLEEEWLVVAAELEP